MTLLTGCGSNQEKKGDIKIEENTDHIAYLEKFGWHVDKIQSTTVYTKGEFNTPDKLELYTVSTLDLKPYLEEEIRSTSYKLLEKYNGSQLFGIVFEFKGEIVGGILGLEEYSPGVSSLDRDDIPKEE